MPPRRAERRHAATRSGKHGGWSTHQMKAVGFLRLPHPALLSGDPVLLPPHHLLDIVRGALEREETKTAGSQFWGFVRGRLVKMEVVAVGRCSGEGLAAADSSVRWSAPWGSTLGWDNRRFLLQNISQTEDLQLQRFSEARSRRKSRLSEKQTADGEVGDLPAGCRVMETCSWCRCCRSPEPSPPADAESLRPLLLCGLGWEFEARKSAPQRGWREEPTTEWVMSASLPSFLSLSDTPPSFSTSHSRFLSVTQQDSLFA